jgi:clumping factor A
MKRRVRSLRTYSVLPELLAALVLSATSAAHAAPVKRISVDQKGDFLLIGNTLGQDCANGTPAPVVGTIGACGSNTNDSAPDVYWRSEEPGPGQASASTVFTPDQGRSTAALAVPSGATITHARLYWAAKLGGVAKADELVTLDRPGGGALAVTADVSYEKLNNGDTVYNASADVTGFVAAQGSGAFRVSGVDSKDFRNVDNSVNYAGWSMIVLYSLPTDPPRNITLFDGLDEVTGAADANATIDGFLVPNAGFSARLGVVAYEGDGSVSGDQLIFNGTVLTDAQNPANNFFNSSRSTLGSPVTVVGDLPQLSGVPGSYSGIDLDVVDITAQLTGGDTSATLSATSTGDNYFLAAFVTSISTFKPDFSSAGKTVVDLDGGSLRPGDQLEYTISVTNTGNDASVNTVMVDALPLGVTYVPGSLEVASGANAGAKTDAAADDQGEYDAGARSVTVRVGAGATAAAGGMLAAGEGSVIRFRVTVDASATGTISNQASITASGQQGAPSTTTPTDGDSNAPGSSSTDVVIDLCDLDADCTAPAGICDTAATPNVCVGCLSSTNCSGTTPVCDLPTKTCKPCAADAECGAAVCLPSGACALDTDGDGIVDPMDNCPAVANADQLDTDGDTLGDACDDDGDNDGIPTATEIALATGAGLGSDVDGDGKSNWLDTDADGDGKPDAVELTGDIDQDGIPNFLDASDGADPDADTDGDGLKDIEEVAIGTDPKDADSDDDGVLDGAEVGYKEDTDGDGKINALDPDSDDDGLLDGTEQGKTTPGTDTDVSKGNFVADSDPSTTTSPVVADTDKGTVSDGVEDSNHNGKIDAGETDPNDPTDDEGQAGAGGASGSAGAAGATAGGSSGAGQGGVAGSAGSGGAGAAGKGGAGAAGKGGAGAAGTGGAGAAGTGGAGAAGTSGAGAGGTGGAGSAGKGGAGAAGQGAAGSAGKAAAAGSTAAGASGANNNEAEPEVDITLEGAGFCAMGANTTANMSALPMVALLALGLRRRRSRR